MSAHEAWSCEMPSTHSENQEDRSSDRRAGTIPGDFGNARQGPRRIDQQERRGLQPLGLLPGQEHPPHVVQTAAMGQADHHADDGHSRRGLDDRAADALGLEKAQRLEASTFC